MRAYGIDLARMWEFIEATIMVGGTVAKLTLATAEWIRLFAKDDDSES